MRAVVYENARVYTGQAAMAEAIAVRGERIVAVGDAASCREAAGAGARREDLGGMTVLPGLCDSHIHIHTASCAHGLRQAELRDATSLSECLRRIGTKVRESTSDS